MVPVTARGPTAALLRFSIVLNHGWAVLHVLGALTLCGLWFGGIDPSRLSLFASCGALVACVVLASGLTYWQGDRIVTLAAPAWCVLYTAMGDELACRVMLGFRRTGPR